MVVCLERGADLHMAQLMPLPLTASCFSKIQIGFTFLVPAHPGSPGKRAVKRVCVCVLSSPGFEPQSLDCQASVLSLDQSTPSPIQCNSFCYVFIFSIFYSVPLCTMS